MVGVVPRNPEIERLILSSLKDKILSVLWVENEVIVKQQEENEVSRLDTIISFKPEKTVAVNKNSVNPNDVQSIVYNIFWVQGEESDVVSHSDDLAYVEGEESYVQFKVA
jgi:hypothetical protein